MASRGFGQASGEPSRAVRDYGDEVSLIGQGDETATLSGAVTARTSTEELLVHRDTVLLPDRASDLMGTGTR